MPTEPPKPSRIFLDSSVLFAALASATGASRAIILLAEIKLLKLVVTPQIFDEVERNLNRKAPRAVPLFERLKKEIAWEIVPAPSAESVAACAQAIAPKDAPILAAAMNAQPARLITLDQEHFLISLVKDFSKLTIETPGDLINEIRSLLAIGLTAESEEPPTKE